MESTKPLDASFSQYFGYARVEAANKALAKAGIGWDQVGAVELNEAFAAQSLACINAWGIDPAIVNGHGGAIAMGHPLGASGARILGTLARSLQASGERWGVAAICIGVGQGLAVVLESVTTGAKGCALVCRVRVAGGRRLGSCHGCRIPKGHTVPKPRGCSGKPRMAPPMTTADRARTAAPCVTS